MAQALSCKGLLVLNVPSIFARVLPGALREGAQKRNLSLFMTIFRGWLLFRDPLWTSQPGEMPAANEIYNFHCKTVPYC